MKPRVLLVDDSEELLDVYREGLEALGYAVDTALSAERALEIVKRHRPDIVITDVCMPGMSGLELLTRLRSDLPPPVPCLVVLSGFPRAEDEAFERGAHRFLLKPLAFGDLVKILSEVAQSPPATDGALRQAQMSCRAQVRSLGHAAYTATLEDPSFLRRAKRIAHWLSAYLGHSSALLLAPRNGAMEIAVSSDTTRFPCGEIADALLGVSGDVLESGSRVVLTDVATSKFLRHPSSKIRFLVCVPFALAQVPIGVLCLADDQPHPFHAAELSILEAIAATTAAALTRPHAPRWFHHSGVFSEHALSLLMAKGTEWAADRGRGSGLLLVKTSGLPAAGGCDALLDEVVGPRLAIGAISAHTLGVFVSDENGALVAERLDTARAGISAHITEVASSQVTFETPIPRLLPDALVAWGLELLAYTNGTRLGSRVAVECRIAPTRTTS